jgi:hypothetical protein
MRRLKACRTAAWLGLAAAAPLLAGGLLGCGDRAGGASVATLVSATGVVEKADRSGWRSVGPGTRFVNDDAVRTGALSSARLRITAGGVIQMGENSRIRLRCGTLPDRRVPEIAVEFGQTEIDEAPELSVVSAAGRARVGRGARVRLSAAAEGATLEVIVGRAVLTGRDGDVAVEAGQGIRFRIGGAIVERFQVRVGEAILERAGGVPAVGAPAVASDMGAAAGEPERRSARTGVTAGDTPKAPPPPDHRRADITLAAGDSVVLHNDRLPLAVRLRVDQLCSGEARVELGRPARRREPIAGTGAVVLRLSAGVYPYSVRCVEDDPGAAARATGVLALKRDSGDVALARSAPSDTIEADGRRYTVLYQTRLPALTLVWPDAAAPTDLELHIESAAGGARTLHVAKPDYRLRSGELREGTHTWWYATNAGRQSPKTTVTIRFDNTAPTAQFFHAGALPGAPAGTVPVDGVAVEGARVSAAGQLLAVDDHGRFRADIAPLDGDDAVAVRIEPPHGGSHCYVRRLPKTP